MSRCRFKRICISQKVTVGCSRAIRILDAVTQRVLHGRDHLLGIGATKILFPCNFKGVEGLNTLGKVMNRFWAMADVINHVGVSDTVSSLVRRIVCAEEVIPTKSDHLTSLDIIQPSGMPGTWAA
ncbi:hypothetical protein HYQ45_009580 [Verticillium longisporum]|uniref:Uncharacterized protein n=1 Tax=Verticillium longisporum TaxID=100787 RepID=A0A8I2ZHV3_VERLO|nr:hypothetical protein HYQ45_009580 [Verticillium longisporum]